MFTWLDTVFVIYSDSEQHDPDMGDGSLQKCSISDLQIMVREMPNGTDINYTIADW